MLLITWKPKNPPKTLQPVRFELTGQTRDAIETWADDAALIPDDYLFPSRVPNSLHLSTRQYARIAKRWVRLIGRNPKEFGTYSLRQTKATLAFRSAIQMRCIPGSGYWCLHPGAVLTSYDRKESLAGPQQREEKKPGFLAGAATLLPRCRPEQRPFRNDAGSHVKGLTPHGRRQRDALRPSDSAASVGTWEQSAQQQMCRQIEDQREEHHQQSDIQRTGHPGLGLITKPVNPVDVC